MSEFNLSVYYILLSIYLLIGAFLVVQMVKNPPAMQETWIRSLGWEDLLEEGMATHSSIVWRMPWTEEPGGLWFMGSQRVISQSDHDQKSSYHSLPCT